MTMQTWDLLLNALLLVFWFKIWNTRRGDMVLNPYLAPLNRLADAVVDFLRPVCFGLAPAAIALLTLLVLLVFRGLTAPCETVPWILKMGFVVRRADAAGALACVTSSFLSFAVFLFKLWGVFALATWGGRPTSLRTEDAGQRLARPFSDWPPAVRPAVLLAFGMGLVVLLDRAGAPLPKVPVPPLLAEALWSASGRAAAAYLAKLALVSLCAWVDVLAFVQQALIALAVGSLAAALIGAPGISEFCREWLDLLLGPLRRHPLRIGMLDLSALVLILLLPVVQQFLRGLLFGAYLSLS